MTPSEIADALEARHKYDKINYPPASPLDRQAAATIRELEGKRCAEIESHGDTFEKYRTTSEALKIATEALEDISVAEFYETTCTTALNALARIKEVGDV